MSSADCGALARLQQSAPLLYRLFVQQQLLASQALLATAGAVLSTRLPLAAQPASSSAC